MNAKIIQSEHLGQRILFYANHTSKIERQREKKEEVEGKAGSDERRDGEMKGEGKGHLHISSSGRWCPWITGELPGPGTISDNCGFTSHSWSDGLSFMLICLAFLQILCHSSACI